jgi:MFS family permease
MNNRVEVLRGLFNYHYYAYKLRDSEDVPGVWKNTALLILLSGLGFGISAYFGIGSEYLSRKLTSISREEYEMHKLLFMAGQTILGLVFGAIMIFLPALFFWTLSDLELKKLLTIQFFVLPIFLLEKLVVLPLALSLGLTQISSPFALGTIAQYITGNTFIIYFLASISIFKVWAIFIEYKYLKMLTGKNPRIVLLMVIGINLVFWLFSALFSFVQFEKIL